MNLPSHLVPVDRRKFDAPGLLFGHDTFLIHKRVAELIVIPNVKVLASE